MAAYKDHQEKIPDRVDYTKTEADYLMQNADDPAHHALIQICALQNNFPPHRYGLAGLHTLGLGITSLTAPSACLLTEIIFSPP
jgi:hypothetical protein